MYVHWWVLKGEVRLKMWRWFIMRAMEPPCSSSMRLHSVSSAFFTRALPPTNFLGICSPSRMLYVNANVLILLVWPYPTVRNVIFTMHVHGLWAHELSSKVVTYRVTGFWKVLNVFKDCQQSVFKNIYIFNYSVHSSENLFLVVAHFSLHQIAVARSTNLQLTVTKLANINVTTLMWEF